MKKIYSISLFSVFTILLFISSCKKSDENNFQTDNQSTSQLVIDAKDAFENQIEAIKDFQTLSSSSKTSIRHSLSKTPNWDKAFIKKTQNGNAVIVPINYEKELYLKVGKDKKPVSLKNLSYLLIYNDKYKNKNIEWVTAIPDENDYDPLKKFVGKVIIENWNGTFKKGYQYNVNGQISTLRLLNNENVKIASQDKTIKTDAITCITSPWYSYAYVVGHENDGTLSLGGYDTFCFGSENDQEPNQNERHVERGPGCSSCFAEVIYPIDYVPVIIQGIFDIRFTKAFKNDPKLQCIFGKLVVISADWKNFSSPFISNLLANFTLDDDIFYDLRSLGNGTNGQTYKATNNTYYSVINKDNYLNRTSLLVAKTLVHETIHANILRNRNYATPSGGFYEDLIKYKINDPNVSSNISHHEYMVDNYINPLANFLAQYDNNSHPIDYYVSLCWEGLHLTSAYTQLTSSQKTKINNDLSNEFQKTNKNCN